MVNEFAIVKDNVVVNRIVATKATADKIASEMGGSATSARSAQKGAILSGSRWVMKSSHSEIEPNIMDLNSLSKAQRQRIIDFLTTV